MSGYFGSDAQKQLQKRVYESRTQIDHTPGLCNAGRFIGVDDPDRVGWAGIRALLEEDGTLGFRLIRREQAEVLRLRLAEAGFRLDTWDVFIGWTRDIREAVEAILRDGPPGGAVRDLPLKEPEAHDTVRVQSFLAENGIAPFAGWMLVDGPRQATLVFSQRDGAVAAAAHAYLPQNLHSPHAHSAWVGMVAVSPAMRGTGLGRYINALAIREAQDRLGAEQVYELVAATNVPSRRMVQSCGLALDPDLVCGIAVRAEAQKFTR